jgi:death-on-curing protein
VALQFLTLDEVLAIHEDRIRKYGGPSGIRDLALPESAIEPFARRSRARTSSDAFRDGRRVALSHLSQSSVRLWEQEDGSLACALVFLRLNGVAIQSGEDALTDLVIGVAEGRVSKAAVAVFLERSAVTRRR